VHLKNLNAPVLNVLKIASSHRFEGSEQSNGVPSQMQRSLCQWLLVFGIFKCMTICMHHDKTRGEKKSCLWMSRFKRAVECGLFCCWTK